MLLDQLAAAGGADSCFYYSVHPAFASEVDYKTQTAL